MLVSVSTFLGRGYTSARSAAAVDAASRVLVAGVVGASVVVVVVDDSPSNVPSTPTEVEICCVPKGPVKSKSIWAESANSIAPTRTRNGSICRPKLSTTHAANSVMLSNASVEPPDARSMMDVDESNTNRISATG